MPKDTICDVIGLLVFVGRVQRSKKKGKTLSLKIVKSISVSNSVFMCIYNHLSSFMLIFYPNVENCEDFWSYRWIHLADGTSEQPFIVELFSTSQPEIFENIYPST